jgi:hypothetical protein
MNKRLLAATQQQEMFPELADACVAIWADVNRIKTYGSFITDVACKWRYQELTIRQIEALKRALNQFEDRQAKQEEERQHKIDSGQVQFPELPVKLRNVVGRIVKAKITPGRGVALTIEIESEQFKGNKIWFRPPPGVREHFSQESLLIEGDLVPPNYRISVNFSSVTRSDNDHFFGFGYRATSYKVLESKE